MYPPLVIDKLSRISSKNEKVEFIKQNSDNEQFLELLNYAFNPYKVYGLKQVEYKVSNVDAKVDRHEEFISLLEYLTTVNTSKEVRLMVTKFLDSCDKLSQPIYADILIKKLRVGATAKVVNSALGYEFIPDFKAMKPYAYEGQAINFPVIVQEKMDGVRCIIRKISGKVDAFTYNGSKLVLPNLFKQLENIALDNFVFDSEVVHEKNRLKTTSTINKILKGNATPQLDKDLMCYVFDFIPINNWEAKVYGKTCKARTLEVEVMFQNLKLANFRALTSKFVNTMAELDQIYKSVIKFGGEGLIIKDPEGAYQWKRSRNWLKWKQVHSTTLQIVGVEEGTGKFSGTLGALELKSSDSKIKTKIGTGFSDALRDTIWKTKPIGSFVEIYFNELQFDSEGNPYLFLPVFKEIRIDKDEADSLEKIVQETTV